MHLMLSILAHFFRFAVISLILPGAACAAAWAHCEFLPWVTAYGAARAYGIHGRLNTGVQ